MTTLLPTICDKYPSHLCCLSYTDCIMIFHAAESVSNDFVAQLIDVDWLLVFQILGISSLPLA